MKLSIEGYTTLVFDCDGVVLNSNEVKTQAFYQTALPYGEYAARALKEYHIANGGVSRYQKFSYFLEKLVPVYAPNILGPSLETLLANYAEKVSDGLLSCEIAPGLEALRQNSKNSRWLIVSGGDQEELQAIFSQRGLRWLFDGGIFGSPDNKDEILSRELINGGIERPAVFLGDSKYDFQAAKNSDLDFIFVSRWSEVEAWKDWCFRESISFIEDLDSLN